MNERIIIEGPRARPHLTKLELVHLRLVAEVAGLTPNRIIGNADRFDVMRRAEHLAAVLAAVRTYAKAAVADTARALPLVVADETPSLDGAAGAVVGALLTARDHMQDLANREED